MRVSLLILRILIGAIFLYAGFTKIFPPEQRYLFEMALSSYRLLSVDGVIAVAAVLPWLEAALGLVMILGWKLRYSAAAACLLLLAFLSVMTTTYFRGIHADCGCFGLGEPISRYTLVRDSILVLLAGFLAVQSWRSSRQSGS